MNDERLAGFENLALCHLATLLATHCECRFSMLDGISFPRKGT